jgi:hypothetical protein
LITIEAAMPELPDLNSPEFVAIKARLARTYLTHKADLGVPFAYYAEIVKRVDEITALLIAGATKALRTNNPLWLARYAWFAEIVDELIEQRPSASLEV